jgi:hypothetical protein
VRYLSHSVCHDPAYRCAIRQKWALQESPLAMADAPSQGCGWERKTGFEPATLSLARRCSTTEPLPRVRRAALSLNHCSPSNYIQQGNAAAQPHGEPPATTTTAGTAGANWHQVVGTRKRWGGVTEAGRTTPAAQSTSSPLARARRCRPTQTRGPSPPPQAPRCQTRLAGRGRRSGAATAALRPGSPD